MAYGQPRALSSRTPEQEVLLDWVKRDMLPAFLSLRAVVARLTHDVDDGFIILGDPVTIRISAAPPTANDPDGSLALTTAGPYWRNAGVWTLLGSGGGGTVDVKDEGVDQGPADTFDFTGAGVTASVAGTMATINIPGGSGTPATTVVTETTFGQASAVGVGTNYAREDHTHGTPAAPAGGTPSGTVTSEVLYNLASSAGAAVEYSRGDHTHGSPPFLYTQVDFGAGGVGSVTATVSDAGVASTSRFTWGVWSTGDIDEMELGPVGVGVGNIVDGVSFDVIVVSLDGDATGTYRVGLSRYNPP